MSEQFNPVSPVPVHPHEDEAFVLMGRAREKLGDYLRTLGYDREEFVHVQDVINDLRHFMVKQAGGR